VGATIRTGPEDPPEVRTRSRIVDLTHPLGPETPVFPGDPAVTLARVAEHEVDGFEVTRICLGSHSGTHLDAPRHFFPDGAALSDYPAERLISQGVVLDVRVRPDGMIRRDLLAALLDACPVGRGEFVLLWTGETSLPSSVGAGSSPITGSAVGAGAGAVLSPEAAELLLELGVALVGTDALDLDAEPYPVHRFLLGAGVLLAEGLCNLELLGPGRVQCVFLPLAVSGTDGAPVRAVAWKLEARW
jgi:kynurenine formamidase